MSFLVSVSVVDGEQRQARPKIRTRKVKAMETVASITTVSRALTQEQQTLKTHIMSRQEKAHPNKYPKGKRDEQTTNKMRVHTTHKPQKL